MWNCVVIRRSWNPIPPMADDSRNCCACRSQNSMGDWNCRNPAALALNLWCCLAHSRSVRNCRDEPSCLSSLQFLPQVASHRMDGWQRVRIDGLESNRATCWPSNAQPSCSSHALPHRQKCLWYEPLNETRPPPACSAPSRCDSPHLMTELQRVPPYWLRQESWRASEKRGCRW